MREIKFRGYSVEELIGDTNWVYGFGANDVDYVNGDIEWHLFTQNGTYQVVPGSVGQYTGIKDKNGKEVYEGDIVSVKSISEWHSYIDELYLIEFTEQDLGHSSYQQTIGWNAAGISKDNKRSSFSKGILSIFHYHDGINTEIIGNIYENPELLEAD